MKYSLLLALLAACDSSTSPADDELPPDAAATADCVPPDLRATRTASISGQVIDFVTLESIPDSLVTFTTAWDTNSLAPLPECDAIDTLRASADGTFGPSTLEVGSTLDPPIALYQVTDASRAPTASDERMTCDADTECFAAPHLIRAPAAALATSWRTELAARGVPFASTRGLVVFEFRESDGTPAANVTATLYGGSDAEPLTPGLEVHYLAADRATLTPSTTPSTTASGLAIISVSTEDFPATSIGGHRDTPIASWDATGVLVMPDTLFLEDRRVTTE